jgi:hypothetical protein
MNPGIIHDWSLLRGDKTIASSNYGVFETKRKCLDAFDVLVELAKADAIPFDIGEFGYNWDGDLYMGEFGYNWDGDLYMIQTYNTEAELKADFDAVIEFLKEQ